MGKIKLKVGDKAPVFKIESYNQGTIDLAELIGKQKIVLIFSRYFGCPICQLDLRELLERLTEIEEKGVKILYVTQSGPETAKEFIGAEDLIFPVIPSTKDQLYAQYGLGKFTAGALAKLPGKLRAAKKAEIEHGEYEGSETQSPGQFIIDQEGKLIHAQKGWLDVDAILSVL